jgi:hypothetical protein
VPLTLEAAIYEDSVQLSLFCNISVIADGQTEALYRNIEHVFKQVVRPEDELLSQVGVAGP